MQQVFSLQQPHYPHKSVQFPRPTPAAQKFGPPHQISNNPNPKTCLYCNRKGHWIKDCFARKRAELNKLGMGGFPIHPSPFPFPSSQHHPNFHPPQVTNPNSIPLLVGPPNPQNSQRSQNGQTTQPIVTSSGNVPPGPANNRQL